MPERLATSKLTGWSALRLWAGWALGPAGWALHETGTYAIVPSVCVSGAEWRLHTMLAASLLLAGLGAWLSWAWLRRVRAGGLPEEKAARSRFILLVGLGLSLASIVGILVGSIASWFIDPCTGLA
jgi:TctA family transporter